MLMALNHPCVVRAKEMYFENNRCYTVMERAEGQTLDSLRQKQTLSTETVLHLFMQLSATVAYLHECGVCHRDLKADNIIVTNELTSLKVIDFNVAVKFDPKETKIMGGTGCKVWSAPETR